MLATRYPLLATQPATVHRPPSTGAPRPLPNRHLTLPARSECCTPSFPHTMGQQLNKHIKRKRRAAYLKRRKARLKAAAKKK